MQFTPIGVKPAQPFAAHPAQKGSAVLFGAKRTLVKPTWIEKKMYNLADGDLLDLSGKKPRIVHGAKATEQYKTERLDQRIERHETQLEKLQLEKAKRDELLAAKAAIEKKHKKHAAVASAKRDAEAAKKRLAELEKS